MDYLAFHNILECEYIDRKILRNAFNWIYFEFHILGVNRGLRSSREVTHHISINSSKADMISTLETLLLMWSNWFAMNMFYEGILIGHVVRSQPENIKFSVNNKKGSILVPFNYSNRV